MDVHSSGAVLLPPVPWEPSRLRRAVAYALEGLEESRQILTPEEVDEVDPGFSETLELFYGELARPGADIPIALLRAVLEFLRLSLRKGEFHPRYPVWAEKLDIELWHALTVKKREAESLPGSTTSGDAGAPDAHTPPGPSTGSDDDEWPEPTLPPR